MSDTALLPSRPDTVVFDVLLRRQSLFTTAGVMLLATAVLALSAQIAVPMWPVPVTLQSLVVLVIGMTLGPRLGAATVMLYLAEGAAGLPVFANGGAGVNHLVGPTGGFLMSFVVAAFAVGKLARRGWGRNFGLALLAMVVGTAIIFAIGAGWLWAMLLPFNEALANGVAPFLVGAVIKGILGAAIVPMMWKLPAANDAQSR